MAPALEGSHPALQPEPAQRKIAKRTKKRRRRPTFTRRKRHTAQERTFAFDKIVYVDFERRDCRYFRARWTEDAPERDTWEPGVNLPPDEVTKAELDYLARGSTTQALPGSRRLFHPHFRLAHSFA